MLVKISISCHNEKNKKLHHPGMPDFDCYYYETGIYVTTAGS